MTNWVMGELVAADFKDIRLTQRLMTTVERFAEHPNSSIPEAAQGKTEAKAMYRFFDNAAVTPEAILEPHRERTRRRAAEHEVVLVAQDTTEINLSAHPATKGLGYLTCSHARGLLVHHLLCLSPDGTPLGLLDQIVWTRPIEELGKKRTRDRRKTQDKESQRWLQGLQSVERHLPNHPRWCSSEIANRTCLTCSRRSVLPRWICWSAFATSVGASSIRRSIWEPPWLKNRPGWNCGSPYHAATIDPRATRR